VTGQADLETALRAVEDGTAGGQSAPTAASMSDANARAALRILALAHGLSPDAVVGSFDAGGALADLVRAVLGAQAPKKPRRGAPLKREAFDTFYEVCRLMDVEGLTKEKAIAAFASANRKKGSTVARRYERTLSKAGTRRPIFAGRLADQFADPAENN
jgi:pyruvate/2-oxoglutarate dehydrogenase complex dihydrolipoamide acyltransferase (E2) component